MSHHTFVELNDTNDIQEFDHAAKLKLYYWDFRCVKHTGSSECMPRVYQAAKTIPLRCLGVLAFFLGALAIGLVLLDHQHCSAGGGQDGHHR